MKYTSKSKSGSPSKPIDEKRDRVVTIKLTDAEYFHLKERAKSAGVKLSEFVRHSAFRLTIVSRLNEVELKIAQGILHLSPDFNQAITWLNRFKTIRAAQKMLAVIDEILRKLRPNKEVAYVCETS